MRRPRGFTLLDLLVTLALLAFLVWLLRLDWQRIQPRHPAAVPAQIQTG